MKLSIGLNNKMKNILIRADSSSIIGTGHIMRDLVLAKQYKNSHVIFATQNLDGNINQKIKESGYQLEILKSNDIEEVISLILKYNIDLIIIDHYDINYAYEKKLKKRTNVKILCLDDTYEKHCCDILLNHNISANKNRYKNLLPAYSEIRCGRKYTLLRDEFYNEKVIKGRNTTNSINIFVAMGGADSSNINIKILKVLKKFTNIEVTLVTTTANKNLKDLKKYIKNKKWIHLHINSNKLAHLINHSDFAIVTPSVTLNEVCYFNKPLIAIKTAKNQDDIYKFLKKNKILAMKKFNKTKLETFTKKLLKDRIYKKQQKILKKL